MPDTNQLCCHHSDRSYDHTHLKQILHLHTELLMMKNNIFISWHIAQIQSRQPNLAVSILILNKHLIRFSSAVQGIIIGLGILPQC